MLKKIKIDELFEKLKNDISILCKMGNINISVELEKLYFPWDKYYLAIGVTDEKNVYVFNIKSKYIEELQSCKDVFIYEEISVQVNLDKLVADTAGVLMNANVVKKCVDEINNLMKIFAYTVTEQEILPKL